MSKTLYQLRRASGLTQGQLANAAGVHLRTYQHYEGGGAVPGLNIAARLAAALAATLRRDYRDVLAELAGDVAAANGKGGQ